MGLREEKRERMRREILDAAIAVFREQGFEETRVKDIIDRARVSEATFFNYFAAEPGAEAKEVLLHEVALESIDLYAVLLREELTKHHMTVPDRIREIGTVVGLVYTTDPELQRVVLSRTAIFHGARGVLRDKELETYDLLAQLLSDGQDRGEIRADVDAMQLAEVMTGILTMVIGNCLIGFLGATPADLPTRLAAAFETFLGGCELTGTAARPARRRRPASTR
jgi:AcrR family transcriptional regulator